MKRLLLAFIVILALGSVAQAQYEPPYGGPPMWSRSPYNINPPRHRPYGPGSWQRGPYAKPCIYNGYCGPLPRRYPNYYD